MGRISLLLICAFVQAQSAHKFDLTIDNIMRGPGLIGYEPSGVRWSGDSRRIYFRWKHAQTPSLRRAIHMWSIVTAPVYAN